MESSEQVQRKSSWAVSLTGEARESEARAEERDRVGCRRLSMNVKGGAVAPGSTPARDAGLICTHTYAGAST